jgi:spore germination protein KB
MTKAQENAIVGAKELIAMLILFVATNAFLMYPRYVSGSAFEAAWMEPVISGLGTLILFLIVERLLSKYFPGMDVVEVSVEAFTKWGAILIAIVFAAYFLLSTASVMRQFTENVITTVLPTTPLFIVSAVFVVAAGYIAHAGLEGICRTAYFVLPILVIGTLGLCLLTANWWKPMLLLPIWGTGIGHVLYGSVRYSSIFANVLLLCVIYPHAHDPRSFRSIGAISIVVSMVLLVAFIVTYHMVFPAAETGKTSFPLYQLARMIYLGRFIQRFESVFVFLWVTAALVKMAVTLWGAAYLLAKALDWPTLRPAIPALGCISFMLSVWGDSIVTVLQLDERYLIGWGWTIVFALPLLIVFSAIIKRKLQSGGKRRKVQHA